MKYLMGLLTLLLAAFGLGMLPAHADQTAAVRVDAHVQQGNPNTNFGSATTMTVNNGSSKRYAFVKVDHSPLPSGEVLDAVQLRVYLPTAPPSGSTLTVDEVDNNWTETNITYNNMPSVLTTGVGSKTATVGWNAINISGAQLGGTQSYRIRTSATVNVSIHSQENSSGNGPEVFYDTHVPVVQTPTATQMSTDCGVVDVQMSTGSGDTTSSAFTVAVDGSTVHSVTLAPGASDRYTDSLVEDSSGGSADVVVTGNGSTLLSFAVDTDCLAPPPDFAGAPPAGKMYWGASKQGGQDDVGPWEDSNLNGLGLQPYRYYADEPDSASSIVSRACLNTDEGRLPWVSLKFPVSWESVAAGGDDTRLIAVAQGLEQCSGPVWFTPHHEPVDDMNSTTQTAADYKAMYAHVKAIFDQYAPTNVAVGPIFNGEPFQSDPITVASLIPPASQMDFFGYDLYNAWSPTNGKNYRQLCERSSYVLDDVPAGVPPAVGETGVREDPNDPNRGSAWLQNAYDCGLANGFAAISYFNSGLNSPDGTWELTGQRLTKWKQLALLSTTARLP